MKSNLQHKILLALSKSKKDKGFTLIELLVVIIIIGVLSAVALPNLLGQVGRARETEARNGMGAINRAQQARHFESGEFENDTDVSDSTNALGVVVTSDNYSFTVTSGTPAESAIVEGDPQNGTDLGIRGYGAGIGFEDGDYNTAVCVSDSIDETVDVEQNTNPDCPGDSSSLD